MNATLAMEQPDVNKSIFEDRQTLEGGTIRVLSITEPERWLEASAHQYFYRMEMDHGRTLQISVKPLSMGAFEQIEMQYTQESWIHLGEPSPQFQERAKSAKDGKMIAIIEASTGKPIPGPDLAGKMAWLASRSATQVEALDRFVRFYACGFADRSVDPRSTFTSGESKNPVIMDSFDQWTLASETSHFFRMDRINDDYILEFPLRGVDTETVRKIQEQYKPKDPPQIPQRDESGRPTKNPVSNVNDIQWIKSVRAQTQKSTLAWLTACLPWTIPGANDQEKMQWIYKRPVGEVFRLTKFIESEVAQFSGGVDFFESCTSRGS